MTLHALEAIGDAIRATRELLWPIDAGLWAKLALLAVFIGGGLTVPSVQFGDLGAINGEPDVPFEPTPEWVVVIGIVLAVFLVGWALIGILRAIMEFLFIEGLRNERVHLRTYWSERWRQGVRLFGFRVLIRVPVLGAFLAWLVVIAAPLFLDGARPRLAGVLFVLGIPALLFMAILYALIDGFTTVFVVPLMIDDASGVLDGWRRLWPSISDAWKQYLAYAGVGFVLSIALGLLASFVVGIVAVVLAIPLILVGVLIYVTIGVSSGLGLFLLVVIGTLYLVGIALTWALTQVPVVTYLRYYALLVLGAIEPEFDLIPEQRARVQDTD